MRGHAYRRVWQRTRLHVLTIAAVVVLTQALALPVKASTGLQLLVQSWDPHNPSSQAFQSVFDDPTFFDTTLGQAWTLARSPICSSITAQLGQKDLLGKGFTLYDIDCTMGTTGTFQIHNVTNGVISAEFDVTGNSLEATSTQNTVCGSECDPRFSLTYDLNLAVKFTVIPLQVSSATVTLSNATLDSKNAAGDVLKAIDSFFNFGFIGKAEKAIDTTQKLDPSSINSILAGQNSNKVAQLAGQYQYINMWHTNARLIVDFAPVMPGGSGPGGLSGNVWWTKASQINVADCSKIKLSTTVQTGPPQMSFPYSAFSAAPTTSAGALSISGMPIDLGDRLECGYTITNLPADLPGTVTGQVSGTIGGPQTPPHVTIAFQYLVVKPDGWTGTAVVAGPQSGYNFQMLAQSGNLSSVVNEKPKTGQPINPGDLRANPVLVEQGPLAKSAGAGAVQAGVSAYRLGNYSGAVSNFNSALAADPANYAALYNRGLAEIRLGQTDRAKADLQRAADLAHSKGDTAVANEAEMVLRQLVSPGFRQ